MDLVADPADPADPSATRRTALAGLVGLAAAMGIGRFAFTPLLPLMQAGGLTLPQGAWLASANYLGYLAGALVCTAWSPSPHRAVRGGLLAVALSTIAMGVSPGFAAALLWRGVAGVASAFVLVGVSAWALPRLAALGRSDASGAMFAGVGLGMVVAGVAALAVGVVGGPAAAGWWTLGAIALAASAATWRTFDAAGPASAPAVARAGGASARLGRHALLIACYGAFGFGYIVPATFLPAMARHVMPDPAVFGWTWPVFGAAAALSAWIGGALSRRVAARTLWAASQAVMALGVLLPALAPQRVDALIASAVCVGGTFIVVTLAGLQEARRVGGPAAPRLMAAMTAAFGMGQVLGPLAVGTFGAGAHGVLANAAIAAALLLASSLALLARSGHVAPSLPSA